jgi:hypothetical protein
MGSFLGWFVGFVVTVQAIFVLALASLVGPVQNIFLSPYTISITLNPIAQQAGQTVVLVPCLLVCVSAPTPDKELLIFLYVS